MVQFFRAPDGTDGAYEQVIAPFAINDEWVYVPCIVYPSKDLSACDCRFAYTIIMESDEHSAKAIIVGLLEAGLLIRSTPIPKDWGAARIGLTVPSLVHEAYARLKQCGLLTEDVRAGMRAKLAPQDKPPIMWFPSDQTDLFIKVGQKYLPKFYRALDDSV